MISFDISKDNISSSSATVGASVSGYSLPSDYTEGSIDPETGGTETSYQFSNLTYEWSFPEGSPSGDSVVQTFSVTAGIAFWFSVSVTVSCTRTVTTTTVTVKEDESGKKTSETSTETTSENWPIGVEYEGDLLYTKPSEWSWNIPSGSNVYIHEYINPSTWYQFMVQVGRFKSWESQSSCYSDYLTYTLASDKYPNSITAKGYNDIANVLGVTNVTAGQTLITRDVFENLARATY